MSTKAKIVKLDRNVHIPGMGWIPPDQDQQGLRSIPICTVGTALTTLLDTGIDATKKISRMGWTVKARSTNSGSVYFGGPDIVADGSLGLSIAANQTVDIYVADGSKIWCIATTAGNVIEILPGA